MANISKKILNSFRVNSGSQDLSYMPGPKIKDLLRKYLAGDATPEETDIVDKWYDSLSPSNDGLRLSDHERKDLRKRYWSFLQEKMRRGERVRRIIRWPGAMAIAACVSLAIAAFVFYFHPAVKETVPQTAKVVAGTHEFSNDSPSDRRIDLPDGSQVTLSPGSSLRYTDTFNNRDRRVQLSGQAFFEIFHNQQKPFYVFANEVVTKVLGTSFSVEAYPDGKDITVSVKSGKVSVYTRGDTDSALAESEKVILTPNQKAVYSRSENKVSRMLVRNPDIVIPQEEAKKIRFEGASASEIFVALEKMYGVEITFDEGKFSNCFLTTSVKGNDLYERIDVICDIIGATYAVEGTTIVISGAGCNN
jgi:ferric-dicitrate binding protein FerR (iron transport regulator)